MSASKKMITLKTSDGESFDIDEAVAIQSETIAHLIEDGCAENGVPLANVTSKILAIVLEYCKKHVDDGKDSLSEEEKEELKKSDDDYFMNIDRSMLFEVMLAANYLNIKNRVDFCCKTVADAIKGMQVDQIRAYLNVEGDFSPEEEAENRKNRSWNFE